MSKMDRITEKHPALSLGDLKFAGEFLEEICDCDYPKETALLAESLLWRHLNKTSHRKRSTFK